MKSKKSNNVIKQGNSLLLKYGLDPAQDLSVNWICRVVVKKTKSEAAEIDKNLTTFDTGSENFTGKLTPVETASLEVGNYWLMAQLSNSLTEDSIEIHEKLTVEEQGVF